MVKDLKKLAHKIALKYVADLIESADVKGVMKKSLSDSKKEIGATLKNLSNYTKLNLDRNKEYKTKYWKYYILKWKLD